MPKRFLNVEYNGTGTEIDVTTAERLGEVQDAIKLKLSNALANVDAPQLQLYDKQGKHITDLDDIPEEYYMKSKNGGLFLVVNISASKLTSDVTLPKLGDANSMYDIFGRLSSKPTSTTSRFTAPSLHRTNYMCKFKEEDIVPPLSQLEREAILNGTNYLWELVGGVLKPFVSIGPSENVVDEYVRCVVKSVARALELNVRLEQQSFINSKRADHWVIAFDQNEKQGRIVGCNENKLPHTQYKAPYVTNKNQFLVQIYDQMAEVSNYYGTNPVFSIGSTGREWRFFKLPLNNSCTLDDSCLPPDTFKSKEQDDYSPLTGNTGPIQYDSDEVKEIEQIDGNIQKCEGRRLIGTRTYKWDDQEMLFMLGSVLKEMSLSKMTQRSIVTEESIQNRVMWHLIKTDNVLPWGWANLSVSKLEWRSMINTSTDSVVVFGILGKGADGKVVLVANKKGQVSAMKLLSTRMEEGRLVQMEQDAREEAENWTEIYSDYCTQYKWSIRSEKWMGIPAVIMPVLNQFTTKKERLDNLDRVRECLKLFWAKGYLHDDVYWRNIGYFKANGKIVIVLLDLHPGHVFKQDNDGSWIEEVIERLKG